MKLFSKLVCIVLLLGSSFNFSLDIFQAIKLGEQKAIKEWLQGSQNINVLNDQKQTVLIQAVIKDNKRLVKKLLKKGIEINLIDNLGKTALDYAVEGYKSKIVLKLVKNKACVTKEENFERVTYIIKKAKKRARLFLGLSLGMLLFGGVVAMPLLWLTGYEWLGYFLFFGGPVSTASGVVGLSSIPSTIYWYRQDGNVQIIN